MTSRMVTLDQKLIICLIYILEISELHYLNYVNQYDQLNTVLKIQMRLEV